MVKYAATLALLCAAVMCCTLSYSIVTVNKHVSATLMKLDTEIDEMHRLTLEAGLTVMEARKASAKESAYLDKWNSQIAVVFNDFARDLTDLHTATTITTATISSLNAPINHMDGAITAATGAIEQSNRTLATANDTIRLLQPVISDPAIESTLGNVNSLTEHLDATSKDIQDEVHKFTHPGIWSRIKGFALDVAHVFNPL